MNSKLVYLFFVLVTITITSCSSNSDSEPEPLPAFFNLNIGNEWVYKEYRNCQEDLSTYTFSGKIDSVKVESTVTIEGLQFSKILHKITNYTPRFEYLRVDELGHLVGSNYGVFLFEDPTTAAELNNVRHPGDDTSYQETTLHEWGTYFFSIYPNTNIEVEGNSYLVSPFVLEFTSPEGTLPVVTKSVETNYKRQIGLVKKTNAYAHSPFLWEDRLVSYHIVN